MNYNVDGKNGVATLILGDGQYKETLSSLGGLIETDLDQDGEALIIRIHDIRDSRVTRKAVISQITTFEPWTETWVDELFKKITAVRKNVRV